MSDGHTDGNAIAGALSDVFAVEMTTAVGRCAACGRTAELADTRVYDRGPGAVVRCPGCDGVLLRLVRAPGRGWLELRGLAVLQVALPG